MSKDSHDHAYAERAMVKTAERAETTQVRKAVRELGDVLYKKPHPQWAPLEITHRIQSAEIRRDPKCHWVVHILIYCSYCSLNPFLHFVGKSSIFLQVTQGSHDSHDSHDSIWVNRGITSSLDS